MHSRNVSVALHIPPLGLGVVAMVPAVDGVLVGVETVRRMESHAAAAFLLVDFLREAVEDNLRLVLLKKE